MGNSGTNKYTASASMLGYVYQARYALLLLLQRNKADPNVRQSIGKFDDVAFESAGGPDELIQTKHCRPENLTDLSEDLWGTLRIWSEGVRDNQLLLPGTVFTLITTETAPQGSAASLLRPGTGDRDPSRAAALLTAAATTSKNVQLKPAFEVFLKLPPRKRDRMLAEVYVHDGAARITDLERLLEQEVYYAAPRDHRADFIKRVEGWWLQRVIRHLTTAGQPPVLGIEVERELERIKGGYHEENLPIVIPLPTPARPPEPATDPRAFVARLRRLGLSDPRVVQACLDYYRACVHRDRWAKETLLRLNELTDYDDRLRGEWERQWDDLLFSLAGADDATKTRLGREFFQRIDHDAARATVYYIRPRCTEPSISRGSFHKLADEGKLAWHPGRRLPPPLTLTEFGPFATPLTTLRHFKHFSVTAPPEAVRLSIGRWGLQTMRSRQWRSGCTAALLCLGAVLTCSTGTWAQTPAPTDTVAERLRALEEQNRQLGEQVRQLLDRNGETPGRTNEARDGERNGEGTTVSASEPAAASNTPGAANSPVPNYLDLDITSPSRMPLRSLSFGPGFQFQTEDEAFRLQIHYESQVEGRVWGEVDQIPANNGLYLPRQRIFFNGNITKPVEYEFAINRGLGGLNLLNAFINVHFDDRFEVRFGRYFVPLLYEQYAVSNYWLLTPERSLYSTNVGLNRQFGLMAWGYLFDKRLDYAVGVFNGTRNSFENLDKGVDVVAYLNGRPFQNTESLRFLKDLNIGSSVAFGRQDSPPTPLGFRVGAGSPDTNIPGQATVPFLILNPGVIERGDRLQGSVHAAYFYRGLSLLGEWQYGYGQYATTARPRSETVPFNGFYIAAGYFLTGEQVEQRTRVTPLRPLIPLREEDERGWGAWEATGRVSQLRIGEKVFTGGFADANVWSNSATTTELGLNWYWNDYVKFYMFWLHGRFGEPVEYRPGVRQQAVNMFWLRSQLYF